MEINGYVLQSISGRFLRGYILGLIPLFTNDLLKARMFGYCQNCHSHRDYLESFFISDVAIRTIIVELP